MGNYLKRMVMWIFLENWYGQWPITATHVSFNSLPGRSWLN